MQEIMMLLLRPIAPLSDMSPVSSGKVAMLRTASSFHLELLLLQRELSLHPEHFDCKHTPSEHRNRELSSDFQLIGCSSHANQFPPSTSSTLAWQLHVCSQSSRLVTRLSLILVVARL